jgi:hypothetical protein
VVGRAGGGVPRGEAPHERDEDGAQERHDHEDGDPARERLGVDVVERAEEGRGCPTRLSTPRETMAVTPSRRTAGGSA